MSRFNMKLWRFKMKERKKGNVSERFIAATDKKIIQGTKERPREKDKLYLKMTVLVALGIVIVMLVVVCLS